MTQAHFSSKCNTKVLTVSSLLQESEGEEAAEARVALAQDMGRGNLASRQSRVRLQEIGPRMELQIVKVSPSMLFHRHLAITLCLVVGQLRQPGSASECDVCGLFHSWEGLWLSAAQDERPNSGC